MMHKSPALHWICLISMLIAGLGSLFIGLMAFNYDFFAMDFFRNNAMLMMIIRYVFLAAGIILLISFVLKLMHGCHECHCGKTPCMCDRDRMGMR